MVAKQVVDLERDPVSGVYGRVRGVLASAGVFGSGVFGAMFSSSNPHVVDMRGRRKYAYPNNQKLRCIPGVWLFSSAFQFK